MICWGAANGEGRAGHEVLEQGPVPVPRCVVEVGTELVHRVLAAFADEDLTAEPDDRLLGRSVTGLFERAPVQRNHLPGVASRPEDVVGEEPVAVSTRQPGLRMAPCHTNGGTPSRGRGVAVNSFRAGRKVLFHVTTSWSSLGNIR